MQQYDVRESSYGEFNCFLKEPVWFHNCQTLFTLFINPQFLALKC